MLKNSGLPCTKEVLGNSTTPAADYEGAGPASFSVTCFYRQKLATTICFLLQIHPGIKQVAEALFISPVSRGLTHSKLGERAGISQVCTG